MQTKIKAKGQEQRLEKKAAIQFVESFTFRNTDKGVIWRNKETGKEWLHLASGELRRLNPTKRTKRN